MKALGYNTHNQCYRQVKGPVPHLKGDLFMNNFAKNVLEKEQVKELLNKIKGEERKKKNTIIWIIAAAVVVSAVVAFLVVRYFTEHDCCECDCDDDFDYLDDEDDVIEDEVLSAAEDAAEEAASEEETNE